MRNYENKKKIHLGLFFYLTLFIQSVGTAQETFVKVEVEAGYNISTLDETTFWQKRNVYGTLQQAGNKGYLSQLSVVHGYTKGNKYQYEIKGGTWFNLENYSKIILTELNAKIIHKGKYLSFGRLREHLGLNDSTTSSGSFSFSHNALPIPQAKIGIQNYQQLIFPNLFVKGHFSHGWFGNQTFAQKHFLHQKSINFRIGKEYNKYNAYFGILHNAQWGGVPKYDLTDRHARFINGKFPTGWYTYRNIVLPLFNPRKDSLSNISSFDYENRFGNHIGQINLGASINRPFSQIMVYKEIPFETGQTFSSFTNIDDGLYGISYISKLSKPFIKRISLEYFQTTNQGMYRPGLLKLLGIQGKHYGRNKNNYFNHNQYLDGWSYNESNIGSPFVIPRFELNLKEYLQYPAYKFLYNSVKAVYLGSENYLWNIRFLTKLSISKNFGLADFAMPNKQQFSGNISATKFFEKIKSSVSMNIGLDRGDLIRKNAGLQIAWKRSW